VLVQWGKVFYQRLFPLGVSIDTMDFDNVQIAPIGICSLACKKGLICSIPFLYYWLGVMGL
jgi:hypothetical protein